MKTGTLLLILLAFSNASSPFEKFIKIVPENWSYRTDYNLIVITRKDSIDIQYCGLSPLRREPVGLFSYEIQITTTKKLSSSEIKRRLFLQDSLLKEHERKYEFKTDKINYGELAYFRYNKNKIDSLRIPFYSNKNYSYFIQNNFPSGYCILNDTVESGIRIFERKLYFTK
jgi:hypothetical protein